MHALTVKMPLTGYNQYVLQNTEIDNGNSETYTFHLYIYNTYLSGTGAAVCSTWLVRVIGAPRFCSEFGVK
jgi:hypothetical protein